MLFKTTFTIKNITVTPPLALAPMVGLSHSAMRSLVGEQGGIGLFFTEMLSVKRLPSENALLSPSLIRADIEDPLFYQVFFANTPDLIIPAIKKLENIGAQGIDLNFGCPAPKLRKIGAGCFLTENHTIVKELISLFRKNTELPLTVKIRLGKQQNKYTLMELCKIIEGEGADCITLHARLQEEKFCRKPRWDWIANVKKQTHIPLIANGGIFSVADAKNCLEISGADGLMLGRGAIVKPWIFREISDQLFGIKSNIPELTIEDIYFRFYSLLSERFAPERRLGRLKQFTHYYAKAYTFGHHFAADIQASKTMNEAKTCAETFFADNAPKQIRGEHHV